MATNNRTALISLKSKLAAIAGVSAFIGEPKKGMQNGTVSVINDSGRVDETTLVGPREVHTFTLRRYENGMQEPWEDVEMKLDAWRAEIMSDIFGDHDLNGGVAHVLPVETRWDYGYQTIENTVYRLLDLTFSFRVDDRATFAA